MHSHSFNWLHIQSFKLACILKCSTCMKSHGVRILFALLLKTKTIIWISRWFRYVFFYSHSLSIYSFKTDFFKSKLFRVLFWKQFGFAFNRLPFHKPEKRLDILIYTYIFIVFFFFCFSIHLKPIVLFAHPIFYCPRSNNNWLETLVSFLLHFADIILR